MSAAEQKAASAERVRPVDEIRSVATLSTEGARSERTSALDEISWIVEQLDRLDISIANLRDRVDPVLRAEAPAVANLLDAPDDRSPSLVVSHLRRVRERIESAVDSANAISYRVEL